MLWKVNQQTAPEPAQEEYSTHATLIRQLIATLKSSQGSCRAICLGDLLGNSQAALTASLVISTCTIRCDHSHVDALRFSLLYRQNSAA